MSPNERAANRRRRQMRSADFAHAWARSLQLGNPYAKSVLMALSLYVNDETCSTYVGIPTLAEDTDLSQDTVRKRLKWLEEIGAVARIARWRDDRGVVNTKGLGKRTTDDIKLLIDADPEEIEAKAFGRFEEPDEAETGENDAEFSPRSQQGLNSGQDSASTAAGLGQPSQCGEGSDSLEPEQELDSPPDPPPGDGVRDEPFQENRHFTTFKTSYPKWERWDWAKVRPVFAQMPDVDQRSAAAAAPLYARQLGAKVNPMRPERFLQARIFANYGVTASDDAPGFSTLHPDSREARAVIALRMVAGAPRPFASSDGRLNYRGDVTPPVLRFADLPPRDQWVTIADVEHLAAWRRFFEKHVKAPRAAMATMCVPWPWPPNVDGSLSGERQQPEDDA